MVAALPKSKLYALRPRRCLRHRRDSFVNSVCVDILSTANTKTRGILFSGKKSCVASRSLWPDTPFPMSTAAVGSVFTAAAVRPGDWSRPASQDTILFNRPVAALVTERRLCRQIPSQLPHPLKYRHFRGISP